METSINHNQKKGTEHSFTISILTFSLRSRHGFMFFPRFFFLLFFLFHIYYFAYPNGFGYTALGTVACFMLHSMWFFWHCYELPAFASGLINANWPCMSMSNPSNRPLDASFGNTSELLVLLDQCLVQLLQSRL